MSIASGLGGWLKSPYDPYIKTEDRTAAAQMALAGLAGALIAGGGRQDPGGVQQELGRGLGQFLPNYYGGLGLAQQGRMQEQQYELNNREMQQVKARDDLWKQMWGPQGTSTASAAPGGASPRDVQVAALDPMAGYSMGVGYGAEAAGQPAPPPAGPAGNPMMAELQPWQRNLVFMAGPDKGPALLAQFMKPGKEGETWTQEKTPEGVPYLMSNTGDVKGLPWYEYKPGNEPETWQRKGDFLVSSRGDMKPVPLPASAKTEGGEGGAKITDVAALRDDFRQESKDFVQVRDAFGKVQQAAQNPSAANDVALIFNYMKMLDPSSVVREGEFATAQNAAGIPDQIINMYNRAISGERLNENQRAQFVDSAAGVFQSQLGFQKQSEEQYRGIAERLGMDPQNVVVDYLGEKYRDWQPGNSSPQAATPAIAAPAAPAAPTAMRGRPVPPPTDYTQEDLEYTAKQHGMTVEEVKRELGIQ